MASISNFDVSRILIKDNSSRDILYSDLFNKMILKKEKLGSYKGFDLHAFNDIVTRPYRCMKLMVTLDEGRDTRTIDSELLVIPCKSFYNCILG